MIIETKKSLLENSLSPLRLDDFTAHHYHHYHHHHQRDTNDPEPIFIIGKAKLINENKTELIESRLDDVNSNSSPSTLHYLSNDCLAVWKKTAIPTSIDVVKQSSQLKTLEEDELKDSSLSSSSSSSSIHLTHLPPNYDDNKKLKKSQETKTKLQTIIYTHSDHLYCNLSKKKRRDHIVKKNPVNRKLTKIKKLSKSDDQKDNCLNKILYQQHPTEEFTIVPININLSSDDLHSDSKVLLLNEINFNEISNIDKVTTTLELIDSSCEPAMSTIVDDNTNTIQYITIKDEHNKISTFPSLYPDQKSMMIGQGKVATNKNNYEITSKRNVGSFIHNNCVSPENITKTYLNNVTGDQFMFKTSLPPVETILCDPFSSHYGDSIMHSSSIDNFEENDINSSFVTPIVNNRFYYNQDLILEEDDNLFKCLPYGRFYDDDKEFNQLISSSLPSSNTSSPDVLLDGNHDLLNAPNHQNASEESNCFSNENDSISNNHEKAFGFMDNNNLSSTNKQFFENENLNTGSVFDQSMFGNDEKYVKLYVDPMTNKYHSGNNSMDLFNNSIEETFITSINNSNLGLNNRKSMSMMPMIANKSKQDLTLTQINSVIPTVKEDERNSIKTWSNSEPSLSCNTNLLDCENLADFDYGLLQQQQNRISSKKSMVTNKMFNYKNCSLFENNRQDISGENLVNSDLIIPSNTLNSTMLYEQLNVMDDSLEIESYYHPQQQQPFVCSSQSFSTADTSSNHNSFVIQENLNSLPRIYSSPLSQGQSVSMLSNMENDGGGAANSLNQRHMPLMNNPPKSNNSSTNLISKSLSTNDSVMNFSELKALIASPTSTNLVSNNSTKFHLLSNSSHMTAYHPLFTQINHNNRMRNNSVSTDISSHDEGFASQPEDDFDDNSDNNSEMINNTNGSELIDNEIFMLDNNQDQTPSVQFSKDNIVCIDNIAIVSSVQLDSTFTDGNKKNSDNVWICNDGASETAKQKIPNDNLLGQNKLSNLNTIDENDESDDDDDESFYHDYDASDLIGATISDDINNKWSLNMGRSRKGHEKRYFWQYNVQSKGPKGPRIGSSSFEEDDDPHVFNEISDPVFAPDCQVEGVKHSGKARRGDGNDLTANPKKLLMIGLELKKLSKIINDLIPVTELPVTCRNKSRKEKNKLASRACRLKKKAQHEANKIKLHGLQREHSRLVKQINQIRHLLDMGIKFKETNHLVHINIDGYSFQLRSLLDFDSIFQKIISNNKINIEIAGKTADFVNHILDNVTLGSSDGGINNY